MNELELTNAFKGISEKLNTTFVSSDPETTIATIQETTKELKTIAKKENITLEDKDYLETTLKSIINLSKTVLETHTNTIKIGSDNRAIEVTGKLVESITGTLRELRELNKVVCDMEMMQGSLEPEPEEKQINFNMTADQLLSFIDSAKKNSEVNRIEATFNVLDDEPKELKKKSKKSSS